MLTSFEVDFIFIQLDVLINFFVLKLGVLIAA